MPINPMLYQTLRALGLRGQLRAREPMSKHCSWRVGGAAALCFEPADCLDLATLLRAVPVDTPITWIGLGSNVLIRDGGIDGVVILTGNGFSSLQRQGDLFIAEAGVPCAKIAKYSASQGFAGGTFLTGIPGTIGGALAMNAGAYGGETWDTVVQVETIDRSGVLRLRPRDEFEIAYRSVKGLNQEWFISATLRFAHGDSVTAQAHIRELLARRNANQPIGVSSCGSVFRNPVGDYAGRLIEAAGLKGYRLGGCRVSDVHANFILNDQHATASEIEALIKVVQDAVAASFQVTLEPEVRIIGEMPDSAWREACDG